MEQVAITDNPGLAPRLDQAQGGPVTKSVL